MERWRKRVRGKRRGSGESASKRTHTAFWIHTLTRRQDRTFTDGTHAFITLSVRFPRFFSYSRNQFYRCESSIE